jgi:hypothetical protein
VLGQTNTKSFIIFLIELKNTISQIAVGGVDSFKVHLLLSEARGARTTTTMCRESIGCIPK